MKNQLIWCGLLAVLLSCQSNNTDPIDFTPLPLPQQMEIQGNSMMDPEDIKYYYTKENIQLPFRGTLLAGIEPAEQPNQAQIICQIDTNLSVKAEGYRLQISNEKIELTGKDPAGLMYSFMTLEQIMEDATEQGGRLPLCQIEDYPELAYRAIHLDLKHHLEKLSYYYDLIDELAQYKINGIIVEMEDKLEYKRQPVVASGVAISIEEWQKISDYAKARNIEISPLIQGLGHASFILKHEEFKALRDDPQSDWAFNPLLPETYELQFDLYLDAIEATPHGKYLHIGGDEVHTTGGGSNRSPLELQLIWLNKVCAFAEAHDRIPIFWDDMPLKHAEVYQPMFNTSLTEAEVNEIWSKNENRLAEVLDQFPKNCIYMRWNYSSPQTYGNRKAMEWFRQNGLQVMGATAGQTRWVLMPQQESNIDAIRAFANISIENQADGLLLTLWDDDSPHFELYKRGISFFAEYTWTGDKRAKEAIKSAYRSRAFSNQLASSDYAFIDSLEIAAGFWKNAFLEGNKRNYLKSDPDYLTYLLDLPDEDNKGAWSENYADKLAQARRVSAICNMIDLKIAYLQTKASRNKYRLQVYEQVNKMAAFPPNMLMAIQQYDTAENEAETNAARDKIEELYSSFNAVRQELEAVYSKTRQLNKPEDYLLDQDYHHHLANQTRTFDWQFYAEDLFLEKLSKRFQLEPLIKD